SELASATGAARLPDGPDGRGGHDLGSDDLSMNARRTLVKCSRRAERCWNRPGEVPGSAGCSPTVPGTVAGGSWPPRAPRGGSSDAGPGAPLGAWPLVAAECGARGYRGPTSSPIVRAARPVRHRPGPVFALRETWPAR